MIVMEKSKYLAPKYTAGFQKLINFYKKLLAKDDQWSTSTLTSGSFMLETKQEL